MGHFNLVEKPGGQKGFPLSNDYANDDQDLDIMLTMKSFDRNLVKTRTAARHRKMGWSIVLCGETLIITPSFAQPSNTGSDVTVSSESCQVAYMSNEQCTAMCVQLTLKAFLSLTVRFSQVLFAFYQLHSSGPDAAHKSEIFENQS